MSNVSTPVVFIIFNRPAETSAVFEQIARARPPRLLVIADGPRADRPGEAEKCDATRAILKRVDWNCEVSTCFSETNLGCKERVSSGLTWAFEQVEEAIILEDDCVPDPSFFPYCEQLLEKYRNTPEVMAISGACFLGTAAPTEESYYFSSIPVIWGWATWRRAWRQYDLSMRDWPTFRQSDRFRELFSSRSGRAHFKKQMDRTHDGRLDTWDHQWTYSVWKAGGVAAAPTRNMIRNIGFGLAATHTHFYDPVFDPPVNPLRFPLIPPKSIIARPELDAIWFKMHYGVIGKIRRRLRAISSNWTSAK